MPIREISQFCSLSLRRERVQKVRSSDESVRVERSTKPGPKPPNHIGYGARVAASFEIERSRHWPEVVKRHLARQPHCVCCKPNVRTLGLVQVHHVLPFHYCVLRAGPTWSSTSETSLLCGKSHDGIGENRHLWIGHQNNFQSSNLFVVRDARKTFFGTSRPIYPR